MYSVYNLLFLALLLLLSPYIAVRWILDSEEWRLRLGYLPKSRQKGALWLHGASVGEIGSLAPLVSQVRALLPETPIVVSAMTKTGRERAIRELNEADLIVLSPIDFPLFVRRTLEALKPNAVIIAETELWPNLVRQARSAGAKVAMVSGRISEESLPRYRQFRRFFRTVLSNFTLLCVQSDEDRERFLELGAHPDRVVVAGSLKSDACLRTVPISRSELGLPDGVPIFVAGSTRPGEEEVLFGAFKEVRRSWPVSLSSARVQSRLL